MACTRLLSNSIDARCKPRSGDILVKIKPPPRLAPLEPRSGGIIMSPLRGSTFLRSPFFFFWNVTATRFMLETGIDRDEKEVDMLYVFETWKV